MSVYREWEKWMIGANVVEISTGDQGVVVGRAEQHGVGAVWVDWNSGDYEGQRLWLNLGQMVFTNNPVLPCVLVEVQAKLGRIKLLVSEVEELLKGVDNAPSSD